MKKLGRVTEKKVDVTVFECEHCSIQIGLGTSEFKAREVEAFECPCCGEVVSPLEESDVLTEIEDEIDS